MNAISREIKSRDLIHAFVCKMLCKSNAYSEISWTSTLGITGFLKSGCVVANFMMSLKIISIVCG
jgi:hypothetical protein